MAIGGVLRSCHAVNFVNVAAATAAADDDDAKST